MKLIFAALPLGWMAAGSLALAAAASAPTTPPIAPPALRFDRSPVSDGKAPLVMSYADVIDPAQKAVVTISSVKTVHERVPVNPLLRQFFGNQIPDQDRETKEEGLGSGVIVAANGYILTNNHVVEGADKLTVGLSDGRTFTAKVIGADQKTDIAVVKIDATNLASVTLADSDKLRVGDIVFAIGDPLDVGETVTMGIVSAKGRDLRLLADVGGYEDFIQTDAAINLGNSGGALVDAKGRLVGINSAIISPSRGNIGIGFAIPVNLAANIMTSLIATGTVTRGYLGVATQTITVDIAEQFGLPRDAKGVIVTDVTAGGPAEKAGLQSSDVILAVNDQPVTSLEDLRLLVAEMAPGTKVTMSAVRNGKPLAIVVTLDKLAENPDELLTGITVAPLTDEARSQFNIDARISGLLITAVKENSLYADRLAANMVIMSINRTPVGDLGKAIALLQSGRNLLLVYYQGALTYISVTLKPAG
jgi:Do/DeqQ family serine protease